jgi:hypothetical protein
LAQEVESVWSSYWKKKSNKATEVVIEIIGNGGGDIPIPWYKLFFKNPFQEQYVQFKKILELDNPILRKEMFYHENGKEIFFQNLIKSGAYSKIKNGDYLPHIPQFCVHDNQDCREGSYLPYEHSFKGQIKILVDSWCISSCSGFVWQFKHHLPKQVQTYGHPDSGDTSYARVYIDVVLNTKLKKGYEIIINPRPGRTSQDLPKGTLLRQAVPVTVSTDENGKIISATPTEIDIWVPFRYQDGWQKWKVEVVKAAIQLP